VLGGLVDAAALEGILRDRVRRSDRSPTTVSATEELAGQH
jgi:hypothetical protein